MIALPPIASRSSTSAARASPRVPTRRLPATTSPQSRPRSRRRLRAENGFEKNPLLDAVRAHAATEKAEVVAVCAAIESEIADLDDEEKQMFLADLGLEEPGLDRLIHAGYKLLGLATYFTAGVKEVRAWTIHQGDTAPQAAGVIHTDFERGFIRAQTIAFDDFITYKGETGAKEAGKMRAEGKEYVVKDGDVLNFLFNV